MTPAALRSSLSSVTKCTSCSSLLLTSRNFSTTIRYSQISPQSPRFIEVPQPPQQRAPFQPRVRGTLPPPRDIFKSRHGKDKTTPEYLSETIPEPAPTQYFARDERSAWKRRMAVMRRRNLKEGLKALHIRQVKKTADMERNSREKIEARNQAVYAPPRTDEVLTSSTVKETMRWVQHGPLPDPDRKARVAAMVARVQAKEADREAARRDALHSLYMHARSFITTEEQLDARIEELFVEMPFKNDKYISNSIWDIKSAPPTVKDLLSGMHKTEKTAAKFYGGPGQVNAKRVLRIAEELTGGKMD